MTPHPLLGTHSEPQQGCTEIGGLAELGVRWEAQRSELLRVLELVGQG